ncbi:MAG: CheB methylesterase domain-containing protein [Sulfurimonas sp.]|uniref:chemotaxis protein CheB n=1 Tax=Sulfurimonas sp. TaxID=2022749 RepID=UPI00263189E0|nr:CheB methylesterase domain-containing protein [Sulfurimonas sp.]MDD5399614.1 CheB methylesterase domain-containing protein [Sulfurimonas sp.]
MKMPSKIVIIGASTGGPKQIENIIKSLYKLYDTTVIIAQHMAADFIPSFIKRLQEHGINPVTLASNNSVVEAGNIYICSGMTCIKKHGYELNFSVEPSKEHRYNPDINSIFKSIAPFAKEIKILGVILTGIGDDGVEGCKELSLMGASTITQDAQSAIVDGMPCRARKEILDIEVSDIEGIREKIKGFCS